MLIRIIVFIVVLTPEQAMQAAITKNVKLITTPNTLPTKQLLPMPPGILPSISNVLPKTQNALKPFLPPPPTPSKLLLQQPSLKQPPPLPSSRPPLPTMPPPPPPPSLPPLPPNQIIMPPPPMQPPPIPPAGFPMYPYPPLQNTAQSFANSMYSQPPNLIPSVPGQYHSHEAMASIQYMGENVPSRQPYSESYSQRENMTQQPPQPFSEFDMQDTYEENRQKYNESRVFNRDGAFVGSSYGNGSQHFVDGSQHYSSESGQHYIDSAGQHYSDPAYQQFRGNSPNKRGFSNRTNRPPPPLPQYQNRQVRHHPYQRR